MLPAMESLFTVPSACGGLLYFINPIQLSGLCVGSPPLGDLGGRFNWPQKYGLEGKKPEDFFKKKYTKT